MLSTDEPESLSLMVFRNKLGTFLVGFLHRNIVLPTGGGTAWSERSSPAQESKLLQETGIITDQWVFFFFFFFQMEYSDLPQILLEIISASLIWTIKNFCSPSIWIHCFQLNSWCKFRGHNLWYVYSTGGTEVISWFRNGTKPNLHTFTLLRSACLHHFF